MRFVTIPDREAHDGFHKMTIPLPWVCPECGGPRGDIYQTVSYDGSRRLDCDGWMNPCGHIDKYYMVREEWQALTEGRTYTRT